ncbi:hypothetical protein [Naumannella halotolerans]|uniref:Uncharacterized protein n=1 Tax=Naumannella halotolerans TaxID=993414 RepID=A0A4R7J450_9ACTN|nr:hypothetical protein [Naumannella halotolerans]TDT31123.1 hypothetical protein CLV29_2536 [Naumannella halotolerans]
MHDFNRMDDEFRKGFRAMIAIWLIALAAALGVVAALIWAAIHIVGAVTA